MQRHLRQKLRAKSNLGRKMANRRWEMDRARRERLMEMEKERRENLVVILRDNRTGEERVFPWGDGVCARVRYFAEVMTEW